MRYLIPKTLRTLKTKQTKNDKNDTLTWKYKLNSKNIDKKKKKLK